INKQLFDQFRQIARGTKYSESANALFIFLWIVIHKTDDIHANVSALGELFQNHLSCFAGAHKQSSASNRLAPVPALRVLGLQPAQNTHSRHQEKAQATFNEYDSVGKLRALHIQ